VFFLLDSYFYRREDEEFKPHQDQPLRLYGKINFILLAGVVGAVLLSGFWQPGIHLEVAGVHAELQNLVRDGLLLLLALLSLWITPSRCGPAMSSTGIRFWKWASCLPASSSPSARPLPSCGPVRMVSWPPWCMRYPGRMASR
jgi:hypothetical protein